MSGGKYQRGLYYAVREDRDAYAAMLERIVPESVRLLDGTHAGLERWIMERIDIDYEALGRACIDAIIQGGMVRADTQEPRVLIWKGNAAEQIGEHLRRATLAGRGGI